MHDDALLPWLRLLGADHQCMKLLKLGSQSRRQNALETLSGRPLFTALFGLDGIRYLGDDLFLHL